MTTNEHYKKYKLGFRAIINQDFCAFYCVSIVNMLGCTEDMNKSQSEARLVGYVRVSTSGQTLDAQIAQLGEQGCNPIFRDTASDARADRRELQRMLAQLGAGDVVIVTRIDRLARSTLDLFAIVQRINEAKAFFKSLAEPWADTATSTGRLMLAVLGGLADVERDLIRTRTAEGRVRAKARGKHMGRPPKLTPEQQPEALARRLAGESPTEIARTYNVNRMTIARLK